MSVEAPLNTTPSPKWKVGDRLLARAVIDKNDDAADWRLSFEVTTDDGRTFYDDFHFSMGNIARLAACWNHCRGLTMEDLDAATMTPRSYKAVSDRLSLVVSYLEGGGDVRISKAIAELERLRSVLTLFDSPLSVSSASSVVNPEPEAAR